MLYFSTYNKCNLVQKTVIYETYQIKNNLILRFDIWHATRCWRGHTCLSWRTGSNVTLEQTGLFQIINWAKTAKIGSKASRWQSATGEVYLFRRIKGRTWHKASRAATYLKRGDVYVCTCRLEKWSEWNWTKSYQGNTSKVTFYNLHHS